MHFISNRVAVFSGMFALFSLLASDVVFAATGDGIVTTAVGTGGSHASAIAIQSDGKIVLAGTGAGGFAVVRYHPDGRLDDSFDGDGKQSTEIGTGTWSWAHSVVIQSDGRIVATGSLPDVSGDQFATVRYNTDGSLDAGFGNGGIVTTAVGTFLDYPRAVLIQNDGKIVVAGSPRNDGIRRFGLVRYNSDGTFDTGFDGDGVVTTAVGGGLSAFCDAIAIQSDQKIVAAGRADGGDFGLARYNPDGSLDASFDDDGMVATSLSANADHIHAIALQDDGKIVVAGTANFQTGSSDFAVARYNADGSLDTSFDLDGKVTFVVGSGYGSATAVGVQSDGKIAVAGYLQNAPVDQFVVARLNADGSLDATFDGDGTTITPVLASASAQALAIQTDDRIVVAGLAGFAGSSESRLRFAAVRYAPDGSLDADFGPRCTNDGARDITIDPKIRVTVDPDSEGNDRLRISGEFLSATPFSSLDPVLNGMRVVLLAEDGSVITDVAVPGSESWRVNGRTIRFADSGHYAGNWSEVSGVYGGIKRIKVTDLGSNRVKFRVTGRKGSYPAEVGDEPITAIIVIGEAASGECGETVFTEGQCEFRGNAVSCQ